MGDHVLTQVGEKMKHIFKGEIYGRLGGDEFVVFPAAADDEEETQDKGWKAPAAAFKTIEASPGWE